MSLSVSVVICCYTEDRLAEMREAIASVQRQSRMPEEIILAVDNNRSLYDLLRVEFGEPVRVILNESARGLSATRNVGISAAHGELVAFLDDDAVAEPEWLARLVAPFADAKVFAVGGRAVLTWCDRRPRWFPKDLEWVVGGGYTWLPLRPAAVSNPHGHNMCFRRTVFETVGTFETVLGRHGDGGQSGEERELCLRFSHRFPHGKVIYEPAAVIRHKVRAQRARWGYLVKRSYHEGLCKAYVMRATRVYSRAPLVSEKSYLRYLLFQAIPCRAIKLWQPTMLAQSLAIILCMAATGIGYFVGRWRFQAAPQSLLREKAE